MDSQLKLVSHRKSNTATQISYVPTSDRVMKSTLCIVAIFPRDGNSEKRVE